MLSVALLLGAAGFPGAAGLSPVEAAPNSVRIEPASAFVAPGGSRIVELIAEPPSAGLAAWVVEVAFDPSVVTTESRRCDPFDPPAGSTGAVGCEVADTNDDGFDDTVKVFGAVVFSDGRGLEGSAALAAIALEAVGSEGGCSQLRVTIVDFRDPEGRASRPSVSGGEVCIEPLGAVTPTATPATTSPGELTEEATLTPAVPPATGASQTGDGPGARGWLLAGVIAVGVTLVGAAVWGARRLRRQRR